MYNVAAGYIAVVKFQAWKCFYLRAVTGFRKSVISAEMSWMHPCKGLVAEQACGLWWSTCDR